MKYSQSQTHPSSSPPLTNGLNLPVGSYAVWSDVAGTFDLYKNGNRYSTYFPHKESAAPFDMFGTTGTNANRFHFDAGNWRLEFTPTIGTKEVIDFTVGTVTPPPTTKETVKVTANLDKVEIVTVHDPLL